MTSSAKCSAVLLVPAHYIQATPGERDPRAFTPDESRRARALPMYAALRVLGREGVAEIVDRCCAMATRMAARLAVDPRVRILRILNDVVLNQVLVQFRAQGSDDEAAAALTHKVIARVQDEGTCWAGGRSGKDRRRCAFRFRTGPRPPTISTGPQRQSCQRCTLRSADAKILLNHRRRAARTPAFRRAP